VKDDMTKPSPETLSQYVERVISQKKLNLHDIERNSDGKITNSYVSKILRGVVKNLTADKTVALAQGLGVSPFDVFAAMCGEPPTEEGVLDARILVDVLQKLVMNPRLMEIFRLSDQLGEKDQDKLITSLKYMKEKSKPKSRKKKKD
jgi:transcriptional regulator with XRE-family HTH domain